MATITNEFLTIASTAMESTNSTPSSMHINVRHKSLEHGKSWADDIQSYQAAKCVLPWSPEQQSPLKQITRYEKSREEREYDVVLCKFRDAEKELKKQTQEKEKSKQDCVQGRAKQLRNIQRFDLINHSPNYPNAKDYKEKQSQRPSPVLSRSRAVNYNIISNIPTSDQQESMKVHKNRASYASLRGDRNFNILTNKYHENHETQFQHDQQQNKASAAIKYYKTRTFDPIRITYVDTEKEKEYQIQRAQEQAIHGQDRLATLPPGEKYSEGRLYNILNQKVLNPSLLQIKQNKDQRVLNKMQKSALESRMKIKNDTEAVLRKEKELNRFAHERHAESYCHGYDIVTTQAYTGRAAKHQVPTRTHAQLPVWKVLEKGTMRTEKITHGEESDRGDLSQSTNSNISRQNETLMHIEERPTTTNVLIVQEDI